MSDVSHWETLAKAAEDMAAWEVQHGRLGDVYMHKARSYRRQIKANAIAAATGVWVCSCCLPASAHKPHQTRAAQ